MIRRLVELAYEYRGSRVLDIVFCLDVLEHVPDYRKVIAEVSRVLAPDGSELPYRGLLHAALFPHSSDPSRDSQLKVLHPPR